VQKDQLVEGLFPQSGRTLAWFLRRGSGKLTLVPASIALPIFPSLLAACMVLLVGGLLAQRVPLLVRYSIPAPIVGGLIFAVLALLAERTTGLGMTFDTSAKTPFLLLFFASIGLTADLAVLRRGGARLLRFLLALFPFLLAQDALGVAMARLLGLHPVLGLVAGSITLVGGHGTGAAYAERFAEEHDILGVMGLTMTSATIGLILGGIIGGPVAERLIRRIARADATTAAAEGGVVGGPVSTPVTALSFISSLAAALAAVVAGQALGSALEGGGITVPAFLWCLIVGLIIRNAVGVIGPHLHDAASELIGSVCLSLFLTWTMMTLHLGDAVRMAGPLLIILAAQAALVAAWATWVTFPAVGRDYESAIISGAFCGFAMGATATAIANMQALTRRHGPAPQAFVVVPIVGAFFIDLMNLAVLTFFLLPGLVVSGK
jgi:ESS family glutamate:Na+ symporter